MANVSPGVSITELNLAQNIVSTSSSAAALVGASNKGRADERTLITTTQEFIDKFGEPSVAQGYFHYSALGYLRDGNQLYATRVHNGALFGGVVINQDGAASSSAVLLAGEALPASFDFSSFSDGLFAVFADNQGAWGNNVSIQVTNVNETDNTFDIVVFNTANGVTTQVESWTVSRETKLDGFNKQLYLETRINENSNWIRVTDNTTFGIAILPDHDVSAEILDTGDGILTTFAGTFAKQPIQPGTVSITDTVETFVDDENGGLVGDLGGTGTLNYTTGAFSITFNTAPINSQNITTDYFFVVNGVFTLGVNGSAVTDSDLISGWDLYINPDDVDVRMLINGGNSTVNVQNKLVSVAVTRNDAIAILDVPTAQQSASNAVVWRRDTQNINSSFAALYTSDVTIFDIYSDAEIDVPPSGYMAGIYARTILNKPTGAAPAGIDTSLNIRGLSQVYTKGQADTLYGAGINYIRSRPGQGFQVFGQKTQDGQPSPTDRVNVRLLLIDIEKSISSSLDFSLFKINNEFTRLQVRQKIDAFLRVIRDTGVQEGGLEDFFVKCDEENNPPQVRQEHEMIVDVFIKPPLTAEFIQVNVIITDSGTDFSELVSVSV